MSLSLIRNTTIARRSLLQVPYIARACYHPPETASSKGETFYVPAGYPDNFETPNMFKKVSQGRTKWDEQDATSSEAAVKADRGEANEEIEKKYLNDLQSEPTVHDL